MKRVSVVLITAALLTASGMSLGAVAQERRTVHFSDLELSRPHGQNLLMARLHSAAKAVCGAGYSGLNYRQREADEACVLKAKKEALASLPIEISAQLANYPMQEAEAN